MNKLSSTVSELHDNFRKSCEILNDFANRVRTMINDLRGDNHGLSRQGKLLLKGEHVNYIDLFFENKTVEEITELTEYFTEEARRLTFAYPVTFENMVFIYLVAIFDAFFEDLTETVLRHTPNMLEEMNHSKREKQIETEMNENCRGLTRRVKYWKSKFNIAIEVSGVDFYSINLVFQKRHVLVHRNGIVDDDFIKTTESKEYKEGESMIIEPHYFNKSLGELQKVADYLAQEVVTKFC